MIIKNFWTVNVDQHETLETNFRKHSSGQVPLITKYGNYEMLDKYCWTGIEDKNTVHETPISTDLVHNALAMHRGVFKFVFRFVYLISEFFEFA